MRTALYKATLYCGIGLITGTVAQDCSVDVAHGFLPLRQAVTYGPMPVVPLYPSCGSCGIVVATPSTIGVGATNYGYPKIDTGPGLPGWGFSNGGSSLGNALPGHGSITNDKVH
ncbi:MAG: hypothetical protein KGQ37_12970 [Hyphomicrobiales bacterium]|nr:hypothetical protein [Hyphomicrobiales bacterium]